MHLLILYLLLQRQRNYKMYKQIPLHEITGEQIPAIQRLADNAFIPFDPDNTDYQAYLEWLAEGNEPLPADE